MASTAAFNALLKLVEEPPGHVLFAMATTDPQKVLPTILSRVQRLDLRRVAADEVAEHVRRIVTAEGATIDDQAVDAVVRAGDGSVRDTLSILEQVLAFSAGSITGDDVAQVLGTTATSTIVSVADLLAAGDLAGLLRSVAGLVDAGQDLRRFTLDLVGHLRDLLVLQAAPDHPELVDATRERRAELVAQAARLERTRVLDALETLAATVTEQRQGTPRLPLELAFATLTVQRSASAPLIPSAPAPLPAAEPVAAPVPVAPAAAPGPAAPVVTEPEPEREPEPEPEREPEREPEPEPTPDPVPEPSAPPVSGADLDTVVARWNAVIELVKQASPRAKAVFEPAVPVRLERGVLTIAYGPRHSSFHAEQAMKEDLNVMLRDALKRSCSLDVRIDVVRDGDDQRQRPVPPLVGGGAADPELAREVPEADMEPAAPPGPADVGALFAARLDATLEGERPAGA